MRTGTFPCLFLLAVACSGVSCRQAGVPGPTRVENPEAVALVGDRAITAEAFRAELKRQFRSTSGAELTSGQKEAALETLVRHEATYAKAKAAGFDQTPEIQMRIRNLVIAQFREQQFKLTNAPVSEAEVESFYRAHRERYTHPGAARGAVIFLSAPKGMTAEKKAELQQRAERLLGEARATLDDASFAQVVARHSEDQASRYRGGDIGWVTRGDTSTELAVTEALLALQKPGEFAPLVQGASGFYVAKLLERREAGHKSPAEVKEAIRYQLSRQKAEQAERDFHAAMKGGLNIQINHALLDSISPPAEKHEPPRMPGATTAQLR